MRYRVTIEGRERVVDVQLTPSGAQVTLDDVPVEVAVRQVPGGLTLELGGKIYDLAVGGPASARDLAAGALRATAQVESPRSRGRRKRGGGVSNDKELRSPMPGRVLKVLATVGQKVAAGDAVLVIEAMKMENELRASADATVADVLVNEGQDVDGNALLIVFE